jgi:methyl-accepting chemotaxis protein
MKIQMRIAVILAALVAVIMTGFSIQSTLTANKKANTEEGLIRQTITARLARGMAAPLWEFDTKTVFDLMEIEMERSVTAIIATSATEEIFALVRDGNDLVRHEERNEAVSAFADMETPNHAEVKLQDEVLANVKLHFTDRYLKEEMRAEVQRAVVQTLALALIAAVAGWFAAGLIARPIKTITEGARRLAEGDVSLGGMDVEKLAAMTKRQDELGDIGTAFTRLTEYLNDKSMVAEEIAKKNLRLEVNAASENDRLGSALREMTVALDQFMRRVGKAADEVASGSNQVAQTSQSLSIGASQQAGSLEEISSSMAEISGQSRSNAENASDARTLARSAVDSAGVGTERMNELDTAMVKISKSSGEIQTVVKVIDDIAFQINLLALNANVEAARAGKYGKGFAVVADEVRALAVRSAQAVQETTSMVGESMKSIEEGNKAAEATGAQLNSIVEGITKVAAILEEISTASSEQAAGIEQITDGLGQIDEVTQSNTAGSEESAAASQELATQAGVIKERISEFALRRD